MEVEPQTEVEAQMEALKNGGKTSNGGHNPQREVEPQVEAQKMGAQKWRQNLKSLKP